MKEIKKTLYIDAMALVPENKSGVGVTLERTLDRLVGQLGHTDIATIYLVVTLGKAKYLKKYVGPTVKIKTIYLPARLMEVLLRVRLMPPLDWFIGTGVYVFPNYRNWPLWRSRSLTYVYDVSFIKFPETVQPKNQRYLSRYIRRWISRADEIITISEQVRNEIEKHLHVPYHMIQIVPCGVDTKNYYKRPLKEVASVKQKYDIPFKHYLLFVGNIEPRKNLETLLDAYTQLPEAYRELQGLVIVGGDGWLNEKVNAKIDALRLSGMKVLKVKKFVTDDDLPALYSGADALVHPAYYEGFGITPLEAMACGTTVIVSDIPALHEVVGEAGVYFDPADPTALAAAIIDTVEIPSQARAERAKKQVRIFSWQHAAEELLAVVERYQAKGPRKRVPLIIAKHAYLTTDRIIRESLGERPLAPYRPQLSNDPQKQYEIVLSDFFKEQPTALQIDLLKRYLALKTSVAKPLKGAVRYVRGVRS